MHLLIQEHLKDLRLTGEFEVYVSQNGDWQYVASMPCNKFLREKQVDIAGFIGGNKNVDIKLVQRGGGAAHLDAVLLNNLPPVKVSGEEGFPLRKLAKQDQDVLDVNKTGIILTLPVEGHSGILKIVGRIESETISKTPFLFPVENLFMTVDENSRFYKYQLNENEGSLTIDGDLSEIALQKPFFKEYSVTGSGHPSGFTYGWVRNDSSNLYVALDFTPDNTMDGHKDYAKVYVKTDNAVKEFKVSVPENMWGKPGFTYTDKVSYQHKIYEFAIPFSEIGLQEGTVGNKEVLLAFAAYGTAAPQQIRIAGGGGHSLGLRNDSKVVAWGENDKGQINVPLELNNVIAVSAGETHSLALTGDRNVVAWGNNSYGQCNIDGLTGVMAIAAGGSHSLALMSDWTVVGWGNNAEGQIPVTDAVYGVSKIAAGGNHSLALKWDSTVEAWGSNVHEQCEIPVGLSDVISIAAGGYHSLALKSDGTVVAWGYNGEGQCNVPEGLSNVIKIAAGKYHSLALREDGTVVAWGMDYDGQSTVPPALGDVVDIAAGEAHSLAVKQDGSVLAWGDDYQKQISIPAGFSLSDSIDLTVAPINSIMVGWDVFNTVHSANFNYENIIEALKTGQNIYIKTDNGWFNLLAADDLTYFEDERNLEDENILTEELRFEYQ